MKLQLKWDINRIFGKKEESNVIGKTNSSFGRGGKLSTIIGKGTIIDGDVKVQNSLRIDGRITGKVTATETVIVGKEGEIKGLIHAKDVLLGGKVKGNVNASGKVLLESKASISGDINASQLVVDEGALFDGKCNMKEENEKEREDNQKERENNQKVGEKSKLQLQ